MSGVLTPPVETSTSTGAPDRERARRVQIEPAGAPWRLTLTLLFAVSLAIYGAGRISGLAGLTLAGVFGALVFGVGSAPLQLSPRASLAARLAVGCLVALSVTFLIGALIVLLPLWSPGVAAVAVLVPAIGIHAVALPSAVADLRAWPKPPLTVADVGHMLVRPSLLCTAAGTAMWLLSAIALGHVVPGIGGFLPRVSPIWYAGLVLVLAGIVLARREHEAYAALGVLALVLALTLTPAIVYGMPRSQSAGKHIEIVQLILRTHRLHAGSGIYAAYSAFFAGIAWLCNVARLHDSLALATFWPMLAGLFRIPLLRLLFGQVIEDRYRIWVAITLVVLVDAIGADYFSPQSAGYTIGLGVFAVALTQAGTGRGRIDIDRRVRAGLILLGGCALALTHELSPYIVGGVLIVLAALGCARPRWAGLGVLVPAGLWALVNHHALKGYFSLSSLGNVSNFRPPALAARKGLSRDPIVGYSSHALLLGLLVLIVAALVGFARHRPERWRWAYLISAGVGLLFVALNPYGNEGIFRASLFGIPWLALLAVTAVHRPRPVLGSVGGMGLAMALLATFVVGAFGMDGAAVMRRADLNALRVFTSQARPGSYLLDLGFSDLPSSPPTLESINHLVAFANVNDPISQQAGHPVAQDLSNLLQDYEQYARKRTGSHTGDLYAVWSPVSAIYAKEYGLALPSQAYAWRNLLLASPDWTAVYENDGSYLFRANLPPARFGGPAG